MAHRLDPLLRPASIAVVGASERPGTVGRNLVENLLRGGFSGALFAVNPGRESVLGVPCFPALSALPGRVEHVMFAVSDERIEAALDDAIAHGARAVTLYSSLVLAKDSVPALRERVLARVRAANLVVCGANGMGFYNFADGIWGCGFQTRQHARGGNVAFISHSGSGMCGIVDTDEPLVGKPPVAPGGPYEWRLIKAMPYHSQQPAPMALHDLGLEQERPGRHHPLARLEPPGDLDDVAPIRSA